MSMEWHPQMLSGFKSSAGSTLTRSHSSIDTRRSLDSTYDFGVWGASKTAKASGTYWKRTVAPFVVERKGRARSISNFPGYDPARDRNYFDRPATGSKLESTPSPVVGGRFGEIQTLDLSQHAGSRPLTGQSRPSQRR
eukprot:TRINITY_DN11159_c1_g1_i1.p1 TRINITY_DN11159_c1_g1~~TRINITY_DN11159_c1_g1_i1.p1  ORF type:complete len:138 (+),score=18.31 TRINITY_DN11159_c1_g1_i1:227-640(+)